MIIKLFVCLPCHQPSEALGEPEHQQELLESTEALWGEAGVIIMFPWRVLSFDLLHDYLDAGN